MSFAIVCDSTADLRKAQLDEHNVVRVPLYVNFQGKLYKDWLELTPNEIIEGVQAGAELPKTSQPTPVDFQRAYQQAADAGASEIICLTLSSEFSGTYQSARLAVEESPIPVTVFDSQTASWGMGAMVMELAKLREAGKSAQEGLALLEHIRESLEIYFCVGTLEFLEKGGRIGRANAFLGNLLNIKPILGLTDGSISAQGRARGMKRAMKELVKMVQTYRNKHAEQAVYSYFVYIQAPDEVEKFQQALDETELHYQPQGSYEMGAVIAAHTGPSTFGICLYTLPSPAQG